MFLLCINDLNENLDSNLKLFADDTLLFFTVNKVTLSISQLSSKLNKMMFGSTNSKMSFSLDHTKPAQEVFFTCKINKTYHTSLMLHNVTVKHVPSHKHL